MSRNTPKRLLTLDAPPRYSRGNQPNTSPVLKSVQPSPSAKAGIELQRWKDWLYLVERGDFEGDPLSAELAGRGTHARKLVLAAMASNQGFSGRAIAKRLCLATGTVRRRLEAFKAEGVSGLLGRKSRPKRSSDSTLTSALFCLLHEPPAGLPPVSRAVRLAQ